MWGIGLLSNVVYGMLVDGTYWKIYFALLAAYTAFVCATRNMKDNGKRKTLMAATWNGKLTDSS